MVDFMHRVGFNAYVYAPKNDPVHRNRWREPYTNVEWAQFGRLARHARDVGVEFIFGLSALKFSYTNPAHLMTLRSKLREAKARGIRSFALMLDDLPKNFSHSEDVTVFPDLARAQAWLVNELVQDLDPDGEFYFCPTQYFGSGNSTYLWALGASLTPRAQVFWTGRKECSPTITAADLGRVSDVLRRKVVIWDNFPVNDLDMQHDLHVAPLVGRAPELPEVAGGYFAAAGALSATSRIALRTTAAYLRDPYGYNPVAAFRDAVRVSTASSQEAAAVAFLADLARRHPLVSRSSVLYHSLWPAIDAFWAARGGPPEEAGPDVPGRPAMSDVPPDERPLRQIVRDMELHAYTLFRLQDPVLRRNLAPWTAKLAGWARVAKYALGALDNPGDARAREYVLEEIPLVRENFHWVAGDTFDTFARRCVWSAERASERASEPGQPVRETA
ncbi:beta-N-acetylglucosaminidase [Deinococcus aerius]|uniref:Beta-N-acetylglucosaminidase n=2 Tax=Deinococcus aerius TaxID=200253 RepID=A0A2I9D649_9DEIO|nr:beta-N-acetylglucosaminidase [Deinococcus aerius]